MNFSERVDAPRVPRREEPAQTERMHEVIARLEPEASFDRWTPT